MEERSYNDSDSFYCDKPFRVVNISNPIYKSFQGKFFAGHTGTLSFGLLTNAWGALSNPSTSNTNLYINFISLTNYSSEPILAQIWLNSSPLDQGSVSNFVSPLNTAITPQPKPKSRILSNQLTNLKPNDGVNIFNRMISPYSTMVDENQGTIIIPHGGNFLIFLQAPASKYIIEADIAYGWWEQ